MNFTQSGNENKSFDENSFGFTSVNIQLIMILETLETLRNMCCSANSSNKSSNYASCGEVSYTDKTNPNITVNVYKELELLDINNNAIKLKNDLACNSYINYYFYIFGIVNSVEEC